MLTATLFPCAAYGGDMLWCRLVGRNSVELNFVKIGLKCKLGVKPQSFSHELCLYITGSKRSSAELPLRAGLIRAV